MLIIYVIPTEIAEKSAWSDEKLQPTACDSTTFAFASRRNRPPHAGNDEIKGSAPCSIGLFGPVTGFEDVRYLALGQQCGFPSGQDLYVYTEYVMPTTTLAQTLSLAAMRDLRSGIYSHSHNILHFPGVSKVSL